MLKFIKVLSSILLIFSLGSNSFAARQVILTWTPPKMNVDGTAITTAGMADLRYRIFYGRVSRAYGPAIEVSNPISTGSGQLTSALALVEESAGNLYFAMKAYYASSGVESDFTGEAIQVGKVKLLPPGTPEIIGDNHANADTDADFIVLGFYDQQQNLILPSYDDVFNLLSQNHPELLTGELVLVYMRNI